MTRFTYEEQCQYSYFAGRSTAFLTVASLQFIACAVSLVMVIVFSLKFFPNNYKHLNSKVLEFGKLLFTSLFCTSYIIGLALYAFDVLVNYRNPCSFVKVANSCSWFYFIHVFSVSSMVINQVSLGIEGVVSCLWPKRYEEYGRKIGISLLATTTISAFLLTKFSLSDYDGQELRSTCMGIPFSSRPKLYIFLAMIFGCALFSFSLFLFSWWITKRRNGKSIQYFMGRTFQKFTNIQVFSFIFGQLILFSVYAISTLVLRYNELLDPITYMVIETSVMTIPFLSAFEMIYLFIALHRMEKKQKEIAQNVQMNSITEQRNTDFKSGTDL